MAKIEAIFYELRPLLYAVLGIYVLVAHEPSPILLGCAFILMFCAALILRLRLKARRGASMEQIFYDLQPVIYLALGVYALVWLRQSKIALASALVLLCCGTVIVRWRLSPGKNPKKEKN